MIIVLYDPTRDQFLSIEPQYKGMGVNVYLLEWTNERVYYTADVLFNYLNMLTMGQFRAISDVDAVSSIGDTFTDRIDYYVNMDFDYSMGVPVDQWLHFQMIKRNAQIPLRLDDVNES